MFFSYWAETIFQPKVTVTLTFDPLTSYSIGTFHWTWPTCIPSMKFLGPSVLQLLSGNHFLAHKVTVTLTFDILTSKSIGVFYLSWPACIPSIKFHGPIVLQLLRENHFSAKGHCDLDLWPIDLIFNRGLLLVMPILHTKYEVPGPKHSSVIKRKVFFT